MKTKNWQIPKNKLALEIKNLTKTYQGESEYHALDDVSLNVKAGSIFGLLGPNGAGKSTLINIISGIVFKSSGDVSVWGMDIEKERKQSKLAVGIVPQELNIDAFFTPDELLDLHSGMFNVPKALRKTKELLKLMDLSDKAKSYSRKLSGGMKQKLALCCALIHKPKVLFLDEPTTGVDPVSRKEFWEMLKRLQTKGITMLVSTPYVDEAALCDRIALIQDGKILEIDTPQEIVKHYPKTIYNVKANNMYLLIESLKNYQNNYSVYPFGEFVHYSDKRDDFNQIDLQHYLEKNHLQNIQISKTKATIEDTFMALAK